MLAALIVLPAFAAASHRSSPRVPDCSALSRGAIANLMGTGPLTLEKKIGNLCTFTGRIRKHYKPALVIQIVPWSKKVFAVAERDAVHRRARTRSVRHRQQRPKGRKEGVLCDRHENEHIVATMWV